MRRRAHPFAGLAACAALAGLLGGGCRGWPPPPAASDPAGPPGQRAANEVRYGPWLLDVGTHSITVAWSSRDVHVGKVSFGEHALDHVATGKKAAREHRVLLDGLLPGRAYRYRVEGAQPKEGSFWTAPARTDDPSAQARFKVLVYGDNRSDVAAHATVVKAARREGARLALHTGDMVADANKEDQWASWFDVGKELLAVTPFAATVGNHEISDRGVHYATHFQSPPLPPYRSFEYGPLHVVVLDSFEIVSAGPQPKEGTISDAQRAWLEQDLKAVPAGKHVWVLVHHGPYSHPMGKGHGGSESVRHALLPFRDRIQAVFAGHDHYYERGELDGLRYFVVGGGGAPLYSPNAAAPGVKVAVRSLSYAVLEVCGCHVSGQVKDPSGKVLDQFQLSTCSQACPAPAAAQASTARGEAAAQ